MGDLLDLLERLFQGPIPQILLWAMLALFLLALLLRSISYLQKEIIPIFYSAEKARRRNRRRRFAEHVEHELRLFERMEEWSDYRFTELEAEVEAEGRRRHPLFPFLTKRDPLRREKSLTEALENSTERLIHLEGAPGSGKSVALRHVALSMARQAMQSRNAATIIPLYINLKSMKRNLEPGYETHVDAQFIHDFVLESLNRANDRNVATFLEDEFKTGLNDGLWLFLFDSFDEIPEVLSSTEADSVINLYAQAIDDFLHGMNKCRGIIASREYRGPKYLNWSKFHIMPLSVRQQEQLIKRAELSSEDETKTIGGLFAGSQGTHQLTENPMFLSLLCEFVRTNHRYPEHDFKVYNAFVNSRLARDKERLFQRFGLEEEEVRLCAENIAFCMLIDSTLGLVSNRQEISMSLSRHGFNPKVDIDLALDALQFIKLAKVEDDLSARTQQTFTFSHRRLQEHLATMVLVREPERVLPVELFTNGVWRESAVFLLQQSQPTEKMEPLLKAGISIFALLAKDSVFKEKTNDPESDNLVDQEDTLPQPFPWPHGLLHLMGLLQDGLITKIESVPEALRFLYAFVLKTVLNANKWLLPDIQTAISISGLLPQEVLSEVLSMGLRHPSQSIRDISYRQTGMLKALEQTHIQAIRESLSKMAQNGSLQREGKTVEAFLLRLDKSEHLLDVSHFLRAIPYITFLIALLVIWIATSGILREQPFHIRMLIFSLLMSFYLAFVIEYRLSTKILFWFFVFGPWLAYSLIIFFIQEPVSSLVAIWFVLGVLSLSPLLWTRSAYKLAENGEYVKPIQWPIALLIPTIRVLPDVLTEAFKSIRDFFKIFKEAGKTFLARPKQSVLFLFFSLVAGASFIWVTESEVISALAQLILLAILLVPILGFMGISTVRGLRRYLFTRQLLRGISQRVEKLGMKEFLRVIAQLDSGDPQVEFIRSVKNRALLETSTEDISLLLKMVSQLQHDLLNAGSGKHDDFSPLLHEHDFFGEWYLDYRYLSPRPTRYRRKLNGLADLGWKGLDELNLIVEQAKQALQS